MITNLVELALAIVLQISCIILLQPANGTRPLLVAMGGSGLFAVYIAVVRVFDLQATTRPFFGFVFTFWILVQLWALWAVALHTRHPFCYMICRLFRRNKHG